MKMGHEKHYLLLRQISDGRKRPDFLCRSSSGRGLSFKCVRRFLKMFILTPGGGGTAIYGLYRYVPL